MIKLSISLIFSMAIINSTFANKNLPLDESSTDDFEVIYSGQCDKEFCAHKPINRVECDLYEAIDAFKRKRFVESHESIYMPNDTPYKTRDYFIDDAWGNPEANMQAMVQGEVNCGIRYFDREKIRYTVKTFLNPEETSKFGYQPTHYGRCGVCSSLQDLMVYLKLQSNFTLLADQCFFQEFVLDRLPFECYERLGFTESCARIWAFKSTNTKINCHRICSADYDWINWFKSLYTQLTSRFFNKRSKPTDFIFDYRQVEPIFYSCSQCDEHHSGLIFNYNAARTQSNSKGINHCYY